MNGLQHQIRMRTLIYSCLLVICISKHSVFAGKDNLLRKLKATSYPWFGEDYIRNCPDSDANWPTCYNLRPNEQESIIKRAGLSEDLTLTNELEVVFNAPEEVVDVCGKNESMPEVKEFTLDQDGTVTKSSLDLGAEIYRNQPKVNWDAKEGVMYTLVFWDVGFFKIRGWFYNIELKGSELIGMTNSPYYPPANPTPNINPILVMLFKQAGVASSTTDETMDLCVDIIPNKPRAERCRNSFISWINESLNLLGLQVYYTNGASLYEKFRACTESFICDKSCTEKFIGHYLRDARLKNETHYLKEEHSKLDFYVNFRFTGVKDETLYLQCCSPYLRKKFEYRPRPGNNENLYYVGQVNPNIFSSRMTLEMSGPADALKEKDTYYSVQILDIHAPNCVPFPYVHYQLFNFEYPGQNLEMEKESRGLYTPPWPPGEFHTYIIILYSHQEILSRGNREGGCFDVERWYLKTNITCVRSISWFRSSEAGDCRLLDCPANVDQENPFTLIGGYKASSDFPPDVTSTENIGNENGEISTKSTGIVSPHHVNGLSTTVKTRSCFLVLPVPVLTVMVLVSAAVLLPQC